jgi:hypothetical protein
VKALAIWLGMAVAVMGTFAIGYNFWRTSNPEQVLVVVDSSFPMEEVWRHVPAELDDIDDRRYAEFALVTDKESIHSWSDTLDLGDVTPFAPRDLERFSQDAPYPEFDEASEVILVTNADPAEVEGITDWKVVTIESDAATG